MALRFSHDCDLDGPQNMARDLALLDGVEYDGAAARVYGWDDVWVTLGRGQAPETVLLAPKATRHIVRPTGGGAVLHGHDITVAMAFGRAWIEQVMEREVSSRSVAKTYRAASRPLITALQACGIDVALAEEVGGELGDPRRLDCFAGCSANDIVDCASGQKVCGCALRLTRNAVLVQASIPIRIPCVEPAKIICGGVPTRPVQLESARFIDSLYISTDNVFLNA